MPAAHFGLFRSLTYSPASFCSCAGMCEEGEQSELSTRDAVDIKETVTFVFEGFSEVANDLAWLPKKSFI